MESSVSLLRNKMFSINKTVQYENISQDESLIAYKCVADGVTGIGVAHTEQEAKEAAALAVLGALGRRRLAVPVAAGVGPPAPPAPRYSVALLKELVDQYRLPAVKYLLVGESEPPDMSRQFTVRVEIGQNARYASATTKKLACDLAAEQLYRHQRVSLSFTDDFDEEEALARAHERGMNQYYEPLEYLPWRPDLSLEVAESHLILLQTLFQKTITVLQEGSVRIEAHARGLPVDQSAITPAAAADQAAIYLRLANILARTTVNFF